MVKKVLLVLFLSFAAIHLLVNGKVLATREGYVDCGTLDERTGTCTNCSYNAATCEDGCGNGCDCGSNCSVTPPSDCPNYTDCGAQTCDLCTQVCCISGCRSIAEGCEPPPCDPNAWGGCSVSCGGGTQTNDCGDSRACNTQACCDPNVWGYCSEPCGTGVQYNQCGTPRACNTDACAWWQVQEGNIHANSGNIRSGIPSTALQPYLITGSAAGLVSYSGSVDLGSGTINENGSAWQAQTIHQGLKTDYGYFKRILEDDPEAAANGVTIHEGDYSTDGEISVADGENMIILVNGNVTITNNINVDPGGFLAIISSGNITINNTMTNIEGVYVADGIISSGTSDSQLTGEGIFTGWEGISLNRDFNSSVNNTTPAERFIYRPDLVRNAYRYLLKPKISWQEVAP